MKKDVRAVENPIAAMFDLSEEVARQSPNIRSLVRYAYAFILIWLFVDFLLILVFLGTGNFFLFLIMAGLFAIGLTALVMIRRISRFFKYYVVRHRAIKAVRDMDPMVYAPQGKTSTERFVTYLRARNRAMFGKEVEVAMPGIVHGQHGTPYSFDAIIKEPPGALWKMFGFGRHGFTVYIKHFEGPPGLEEMRAFRDAVGNVSARTRIPPKRVVALWEREEDQTLTDDTYRYVTSQAVVFRHKLRSFSCAIEIVSEHGGAYDFIPYVTNVK